MDIRKVKKLIELLDESGISEIEITEGEESVRISRHSPYGQASMPVNMVQQPVYAAAPVAAPPPATAHAEVEDDGHAVKAPMVGTFYTSSSPGSPPFVQVGDQVKEGDTLCIIEAMKMMNQIEADVGGTIKSIRAQNADPVEYGQILFVIDQRSHA